MLFSPKGERPAGVGVSVDRSVGQSVGWSVGQSVSGSVRGVVRGGLAGCGWVGGAGGWVGTIPTPHLEQRIIPPPCHWPSIWKEESWPPFGVSPKKDQCCSLFAAFLGPVVLQMGIQEFFAHKGVAFDVCECFSRHFMALIGVKGVLSLGV